MSDDTRNTLRQVLLQWSPVDTFLSHARCSESIRTEARRAVQEFQERFASDPDVLNLEINADLARKIARLCVSKLAGLVNGALHRLNATHAGLLVLYPVDSHCIGSLDETPSSVCSDQQKKERAPRWLADEILLSADIDEVWSTITAAHKPARGDTTNAAANSSNDATDVDPHECLELEALELASEALARKHPRRPDSGASANLFSDLVALATAADGSSAPDIIPIRRCLDNRVCIPLRFRNTFDNLYGVLFALATPSATRHLLAICAILHSVIALITECIRADVGRLSALAEAHSHRPELAWRSSVERAHLILEDIHRFWPTVELSICRSMGPYVFHEPALSRLADKPWQTPGDQVPDQYYQILWGALAPSENGIQPKHTGYVCRALVKSQSFWTPNIHSAWRREDSLVPCTTYDPHPGIPGHLQKRICSQFTTSIHYKRGFHGTINISFDRYSALWYYQRQWFTELFPLLVEQVFDHFWSVSEDLFQRHWTRALDALAEYRKPRSRTCSSLKAPTFSAMLRTLKGQFLPTQVVLLEPSKSNLAEIVGTKYRERWQHLEREHGCRLSIALGHNARLVRAPGRQIEIALDNLVSNAFEALSEAKVPEDRRTVSLCVERTEWRYPYKQQGVEIQVADSAPMIPDVSLRRVFERAFTTKPAPHMGLGLWYVDELCRRYSYPLELRRLSNGIQEKAFCVLIPDHEEGEVTHV